MCQKKLRTEVIQLEDQLAQVRREYEMLRIEFEQTLAANEQTGNDNRTFIALKSSGTRAQKCNKIKSLIIFESRSPHQFGGR